MFKIIDVSYSQPEIDYAKVAKSGIDGVIIRCGRTLWGRFEPGADALWETHYNGFKEQGIPVGAYYYGVAECTSQAKQEALQCIKILKGKKLKLPIFYDVEETNTQANLTKEELTNIVDVFCTTLEDAGYYVGVYTMLNWAQNKLEWDYISERFATWIASLDVDPTAILKPAPNAHQYTWTAKVNGINGGVDCSKFYKDFASIIKANGLNGFGTASQKSVTWDEAKQVLLDAGITSITL